MNDRSNDPARAAYEAEQAEAKNEMATQAEREDWLWAERQKDIEADLAFNHARTRHTLAIVAHFEAKAAVWNSVAILVVVLIPITVFAAIITGIKVIW